MIKLYDFTLSGNCYKVRLLLSLLKLEHELVPMNLKEGEHKTDRFLNLNPFGQVPVILDGSLVLRDSQAILVYLARRYGGDDWFLIDAESAGRVMQWLSTAANEIFNTVAAARAYFLFKRPVDISVVQQKSQALLHAIDEHLTDRDWLECDCATIADIACYPYIALAGDGQISLESYTNIQQWMKRVRELSGYISMPGL